MRPVILDLNELEKKATRVQIREGERQTARAKVINVEPFFFL